MDSTVILVLLLVLGIPAAIAIWMILRLLELGRKIAKLTQRLDLMELKAGVQPEKQSSSPQPEFVPTPAAAPPFASKSPRETEPAPVWTPPPVFPATPLATPPPLPEFIRQPVIIPAERPAAAASKSAPLKPPGANWEQFMGVKGFAWAGGFALFLGVAFFVKYSFDNNLVRPEVRVATGFLTALGLLVGGLILFGRKFPVLAQSMCATGVVILYTVTFACHSIYHFKFFTAWLAFGLMVLATATAFLLAVRLNALVVAILGMLGGFLTPVLLSTGQDNPPGLFGYVALLNGGLIIVSLTKRWTFLVPLAALGTAAMEIGWMAKFFVREKYFAPDKFPVVAVVLAGFAALFVMAAWVAHRRRALDRWLAGAAMGLILFCFTCTAWFLDFPSLAHHPWLIFGMVFIIDCMAMWLAAFDQEIFSAQAVPGLAVFGLLAMWTSMSLSNQLLNTALIFYFAFACLHSALPVFMEKKRGVKLRQPAGHLFPILALGLVLVPLFKLPAVSFMIWPFILLVDLLAILLAVMTATLLPVLAILLLTLAATGALLCNVPVGLKGLGTSFFLLGGFVVFFVGAGIWLMRRFQPDPTQVGFGQNLNRPADVAAILPGCSAVLPFLLLIMATARLPLINPSPVFGLALLLVVLLLAVTKLLSLDWMPAIALVSLSALEFAWQFHHFDAANPHQSSSLVLTWYLLFFFIFALFPFLFLRRFSNKIMPWATAALAGLPQFFLVQRVVRAAWPNEFMGLLPGVFALPSLLSLIVVLKKIPGDTKARMTQLALFGGVALFFVTLIFPIQFERQWITLGWALEGVALLWLFHRVPHPGLRLAGVGLLMAAFIRLAVNPAVLDYHPRAARPILNWYLYAYGVVTLCLFIGARLLAPPRHIVKGSNIPPILAGAGTALAFILVNIEIADYFSQPGTTLTFEFNGNFARDMTYSIAWALFALILLICGIVKNNSAARYAAMGLLCLTLLKLFLHDLAQLGPLYRIGAFVSVAIVAMLASFAYQKYFSAKATRLQNEAI